MKAKDFSDFGIRHLAAKDISETNAPLDTVDLHTILRLDKYIDQMKIDQPKVKILLMPDGLSTGLHRSTWLPRGLAADIIFDGEVNIYEAFKVAIETGFMGVGVLFNHCYRMHLDLRPRLATWGGVKNGTDGWKYFSIFNDPRVLQSNVQTVSGGNDGSRGSCQ